MQQNTVNQLNIIIDDDIEALEKMADALQDYGLVVYTANENMALELTLEHQPEFIIMDYFLRGTTGIEVVKVIVVFYMGLDNVQRNCDAFKKHGRHENTPAALIEKGTTQDQRVLVGNLNTLPCLVINNNVRAPTFIVVGEVVDLHSQLNWFKSSNKIQ